MATETKAKERITKGHYGYLKKRKTGLLIRGGVLLIGVLVIFFTGLITLKTNKNWLTIVAALSAIPMAMQFASLFSIVKYKSRPKEEYDEVKRIVGNGLLNTELIVANKDGKNLEFNYAYVHETGIYIYTTSLKMDLVKTPEYVRNYLRLNSVDGKVMMFTDFKAYKKTLKNLAPSDRETVEDLLLQQEGVLRAISM